LYCIIVIYYIIVLYYCIILLYYIVVLYYCIILLYYIIVLYYCIVLLHYVADSECHSTSDSSDKTGKDAETTVNGGKKRRDNSMITLIMYFVCRMAQ